MSTEGAAPEVSPLTAIRYAAGTDIGLRREENQDSHGIIETGAFKLFVVADGMGGVHGGGTASNLAIATLREYLQEQSTLSEALLGAAVIEANTRIFERGNADTTLSGMGTTCVGLAFVGQELIITNVGDSRAYRLRGDRIVQLTEDHTLVMELVRSGAITDSQAANHPVSHMLTRSLGPAPSVEPDVFRCIDGPARGDLYLLCSDGLYNLVSAEEIARILSGCSLDDAVQELIELANMRGGTDNITVILVQVGESFPVGPEMFPEAAPEAATAEGAGEPPPAPHPDGPQIPVSDLRGESGPSAPVQSTMLLSSPAASVPPRGEVVEPPQSFAALIFAFLFVLVLGFSFGYYASTGPEEERVAVELNSVSSALPILPEDPRGPALVEERPARGGGAPVPPSDDSGPVVSPSISGLTGLDEAGRLAERREELRRGLAAVEARLASFDQPVSGRAGQSLQEVREQVELTERALEGVRGEIDVATRRLAVWYGRRRRLQETDPINLANEVAAVSAEVRIRKEAFEQATWTYLKEAEVLRYNPSERNQAERVASLGRARSEHMRSLVQAVRAAIDQEVSDSDHTISELTLRRDQMESKLEGLRREVEYLRILMGSDTRARGAKREELAREREMLAVELQELERTHADGGDETSPHRVPQLP